MHLHRFLNKILGDSKKIDLIRLLLKHPDGMAGRAIGRAIGVSHFKVRTIARELEEEGILLSTRVGQSNIFKLNRSNFILEEIVPLFKFEETVFSVIGEKLYNLLEPKPLSIILHGSMARGEERPDSDIDMVVVYRDDVFYDGLTDDIMEGSRALAEKFNNMFSPLAVSVSRFKEGVRTKGSLFREVLKDGRVIAGALINEVLDNERTKDQDDASA